MPVSPIEFVAGRLEQQSNCIFCQGMGAEDINSAHLLSLPEDLKIRLCRSCDLRWLDPRPNPEAYNDLYKEYYYESIEVFDDSNYLVALGERKAIFRDRLLRLQTMIPAGARILDVGAASGDFVAIARSLGFDVKGVELSGLARRAAKNKYGLELLSELPSSDGVTRYHVIHLNHVLEHFIDPAVFLKSLSMLLVDDGFIVVEVPYQFKNIVELRHRVMFRDNNRPFTVYSIHHPFFYSPRSLRRLFQTSNLELVFLRTWNRHIIRGSFREKWLLYLGDFLFKKGDFIEAIVQKSGF